MFRMEDNVKIKQAEREWQNAYGGDLQKQSYQRPGTRIVIEQQFSRIAKELEISPGMKLLDIGCGMGHLLHWLSQNYSAAYYGIDLALNTIRAAQETDSALNLAVADAENVPFKDAVFDRIVCNGSFHHLLDPAAALSEIYRMLAPAGILVMYEPAATPITNFTRKFFSKTSRFESPADLSQKDHLSRTQLEKYLTKAGFLKLSIRFFDFFAYPLSGMYMDFPLGRSARAMRFFTQVEKILEKVFFLRPIFNALSYRLFIKVGKPG